MRRRRLAGPARTEFFVEFLWPLPADSRGRPLPFWLGGGKQKPQPSGGLGLMGGHRPPSNSSLCHVASNKRRCRGLVPVNLCDWTAIDLFYVLRVVARMRVVLASLLLIAALPAQAQERPAAFVDASQKSPEGRYPG